MLPVLLISIGVSNFLPRLLSLPDFVVGFFKGLTVGLILGTAVVTAIHRWTRREESDW